MDDRVRHFPMPADAEAIFLEASERMFRVFDDALTRALEREGALAEVENIAFVGFAELIARAEMMFVAVLMTSVGVSLELASSTAADAIAISKARAYGRMAE